MRQLLPVLPFALLGCLGLAVVACDGGDIGPGDNGGDDNGSNPGDDPGNDPDRPDAACDETVPIQVTQQQKTPDVLLVLDKSGSMGDPLGLQTKMDVMKSALAQVLPAKNADIRFGLMLYPSDDTCGPGTVVTGVAANSAASVVQQVSPVSPEGATPTHTTLAAALAYYQGIPVNPDGRFVLLATDGLPNCNGSPNNPSDGLTLAAAGALSAAGIKVFVIGFGDVAAANPAFLKQLAMAGGTGDFYPANSPQQLQQALDQIAGTVTQASCSFTLASKPQDPSLIAVSLDGQQVPRDPSHQTGWDYDVASNTVTFYGGTCDGIKSGGGGNVSVDYGCGAVIVE